MEPGRIARNLLHHDFSSGVQTSFLIIIFTYIHTYNTYIPLIHSCAYHIKPRSLHFLPLVGNSTAVTSPPVTMSKATFSLSLIVIVVLLSIVCSSASIGSKKSPQYAPQFSGPRWYVLLRFPALAHESESRNPNASESLPYTSEIETATTTGQCTARCFTIALVLTVDTPHIFATASNYRTVHMCTFTLLFDSSVLKPNSFADSVFLQFDAFCLPSEDPLSSLPAEPTSKLQYQALGPMRRLLKLFVTSLSNRKLSRSKSSLRTWTSLSFG